MIWKRYFYKEIFKTFAFLLFGIFAIYIAIDVMTHLKDIRAGKTSFLVWLTYYLCTFSRRLDVLVPFTVLIGTIRILLSFQARNELVALLVSGVPLKSLLKPFVVAACAMTLLLLINFEVFLPRAQPMALLIQENDFGKKAAAVNETGVREVLLKDSSRMFYSNYNPKTAVFSDVFWVVSVDELYHMQTLSSAESPPFGYNVDHIARTSSGKMVKQNSYQKHPMTTMCFDEDSLKQSIQLPRDQSITTLVSQMLLYGKSSADRAVDIRSFLIYKLTLPFLCLLAALAPVSYCLSFRRGIPHFMIYLLSLASLFFFFLILQVAFVLAKSHVVSPIVSLGIPWLVASLFVGQNYMRVLHGKT